MPMGWAGPRLNSATRTSSSSNALVWCSGYTGVTRLAEDAALDNADGSGFRGVTLAYNTRSKDEVDAVLAHAETIGAKIAKPAKDEFWGGYSGYFADPDGHLWEVAWNPGFAIDEAGNVTLPN